MSAAICNPKGIVSSSPGLRATSYPGKIKPKPYPTLKGLRQRTIAIHRNEPEATTLSGLKRPSVYPQGSLALLRQKHYGAQATLGWRAESLWDSSPPAGSKSTCKARCPLPLSRLNRRMVSRLKLTLACVACFCAITFKVCASENPTSAPRWDTYSDTWTATDALGRRLPDYAEAGPPRKNRFVGIFYFLWLGMDVRGGPYDVTKLKAENPASPARGPLYAPHHWGESVFGYYLTQDPYVLRKHAQMLADAGVDTLIFDVTNQATYKSNYFALLKIFSEVRRAGGKTPQIAFLCPFWKPAKVVEELWQDLYEPNLYSDLWFRWDGKPLILADPTGLSLAARKFFTFRKPQPDYFQGPTQPNMWSWLEVFPQHAFTNTAGVAEQMSVGVAQNAVHGRLGSMSETGVAGRSFHGGKPFKHPEDVLHGYNFAEQFERALQIDPQFIFITGWNEWIAGRHPEFNGVRGDMFPDEFDQENSRDIEPMKGGHGDNYYYQMVAFIRRYKGVRPPEKANAPKTIRINPDFKQWSNVLPEYRDDIGDVVHRDFSAFNNFTRYTNDSGRNDLVAAKVATDGQNVFFYARTHETLTASAEPNWMMLLIDVDQNHGTGWEGYDFIINRLKRDPTHGVLERNRGGWNWEPVCDVAFVSKGNEIHFAIPRSAVQPRSQKSPLHFDFKWVDNIAGPITSDKLITDGDAAPNGRFNYRFEEAR
jgi:hypothetical protein